MMNPFAEMKVSTRGLLLLVGLVGGVDWIATTRFEKFVLRRSVEWWLQATRPRPSTNSYTKLLATVSTDEKVTDRQSNSVD